MEKISLGCLSQYTNSARRDRLLSGHPHLWSPCLGMIAMDSDSDVRNPDAYINHIVDTILDDFGSACWAGDDDSFQEELFCLMTSVRPTEEDEVLLPAHGKQATQICLLLSTGLHLPPSFISYGESLGLVRVARSGSQHLSQF